MKGGQKPVHIQRWAPSDYQQDEHVKLLKARRDWRTLTFYRQFLDFSFMAGGDLPADVEALAAAVEMPRKDVERALEFCLGRLIERNGDRLYQSRVKRDVAGEILYREQQAELGRIGGRTAGRGRPKNTKGVPLSRNRGTPTDSIGPPAPTPTPTPIESVVGSVSVVGTELVDPSGKTSSAPVVAEVVPARKSWTREAAEDWDQRFQKGSAQPGRIGAALARLVREHGWERIRPIWRRYLVEKDPQFCNPQDFAAHFGAWAEGSTGSDSLESHNRREAVRAVMGARAERNRLPSSSGAGRVTDRKPE